MGITESTLRQIIDKMDVARLSVVQPNGSPDVMPIVFARVEDRLFSPIDEKPKTTARLSRIESIRARPDVLVLLDHYSSDWTTLWWIRLSCTARIIHEENIYWDRAVSSLLDKYEQYQTVGLFKGAQPTMLEFEQESVRSWAFSGASGFDDWLEGQFDR